MKNTIIILFCYMCGVVGIQAQTIVLDPGHGYCNDCTQNCTSNVRSDLEILTAMAVGNKLNVLLDNCSNVTTYLTRTTSDCGDFPSLSQRAAMSNSWGADRFLSIHCNAGGGMGTETFWCNNSTSSNAACQDFATEIQNQMVIYGQWNSRRVVEDYSYLNFHLGVLSPTNAIGCLSEIGFVDSSDAAKLSDESWRDQFALAYYEALKNDLGINDCSSLDCSSAVALTCGEVYHGASSSNSSLVDTYGCNTWTETGPERIHSITSVSSGTLTASLSNFSGDLDVYILGSCNPSDCLGTVSSSSATFTNAVAGETYYIVVDADDGSGSAYDLLVTCPEENVYITNASLSNTAIAPGYDLLATGTQNYSGTVSNTPNSFLYYYLSSDCMLDASDVLLEDEVFSSINASNPTDTLQTQLTIPSTTQAGAYYILLVADATNTIHEIDENNTVCLPITVTNPVLDCSAAVELTCGISYSGDASFNPSFIESYGCNSWTESGPERVHTLTPQGNGTLTASLSNFSGDLDVYILGSCDPTDCLGTVSSSSASFTNAVAGETYYIVVDADDGSGSGYDLLVTCPDPIEVSLSPIVYLQGAYTNPVGGEETLMRDNLRTSGYIPTTSPYSDAASCAASVFTSVGANAIVDWVWVELRDANDNSQVIAGQSGLLQRDGDVVATDGTSALEFAVPAASYFVVVNHRSHLGVMSANTQMLTSSTTVVDLSNSSAAVLGGTTAVVSMNSRFAMVTGDFDGNNQVQTSDVNALIQEIGNSGYSDADLDLNGQVQTLDLNSLLFPNVGKGQQF